MTNLFAKHQDYILERALGYFDIGISKEQILSDRILVDINNIAYWAHNEPNNKDASAKDIIHVLDSLPWPIIWFEFNNPSVKEGKSIKNDEMGMRLAENVYGALLIDSEKYIYATYFVENEKYGFGMTDFVDLAQYKINKEDFESSDVMISPFFNRLIPNDNERLDFIGSQGVRILMPILYSILFCHCKNIDYKTKKQPEALRKRNAKRGKIPQESYKELEIDALKKKIIQGGNKSETLGEKALHVCRGHFREYTEDAPLFGHYVGTVWVPMHMRGDKENGTVEKDYKVKV